jgi:hypothetical protein
MQTSIKIPKNINTKLLILETLFVSLVSGVGAGAGAGGGGGGGGAAVSEDMSIYILSTFSF